MVNSCPICGYSESYKDLYDLRQAAGYRKIALLRGIAENKEEETVLLKAAIYYSYAELSYTRDAFDTAKKKKKYVGARYFLGILRTEHNTKQEKIAKEQDSLQKIPPRI